MNTIIKNGLIYDGSGDPPFRGEIIISGGTIINVIRDEDRRAADAPEPVAADSITIDAAGKVVTPGFIDIHRHCDIAAFRNSGNNNLAPDNRRQGDMYFGEIELAQGITTTFVGNCGLAPVPSVPQHQNELYGYLDPVTGSMPPGMHFEHFADYTKAMEAVSLPINIGFLAAVGSIKIAVKGFGNKPYTAAELVQAQDYLKEALAQGAFGVSLGIMYQPECYSTKEELAQVISVCKDTGCLLTTHIRGEGDSLTESVEEVIAIAGAAGIPLNISHFKAIGIKNWNKKIYEAIDRVEQARAAGQDVTADFYPYDGGSTTLQSLLPPTVMEETAEQLIEKLSGAAGKQRLREELNKVHAGWDNMSESIGWDRILISSVTTEKNAFMQGQTIAAVAKALGYEEPADLVADLLVWEAGKVGIIVLSMSQADVDTVARLPYTMLISDSLYGGDSKSAHPRLYGTTAHFISDYVMKRKVLPMETAICKMTHMPAARIGLTDRGLLRAGCKADILVFDPAQFTAHAGYSGSHKPCTGMDLVLMEGETVFADGAVVNAGRGRLLKRPQSESK